jgi:hypothetical protein
MVDLLSSALWHRNAIVRNGAAALLAIPRWVESWRARREDWAARPPVLANSFPKSGTHLLVQILNGLPGLVNYGAFLGSHISSFRFRQRTAESTIRFIHRIVPGEVVRGHLVYDPQFAKELADRNVVNYFIYRDPRDVVVSDAHYLREMNRWHRLASYFRQAGSMEEAISLSITGIQPSITGLDYPSIAERFARYQGWLRRRDCLCVKFEDLRSDGRDPIVRQMAEFYVARCSDGLDVDACVRAMTANVAPHKSHTFRSGKKAGWKSEFTPEHRRLFDNVAGDLLIELGYEHDHDWADEPAVATA